MNHLFGGIEAGGTKIVLAVSDGVKLVNRKEIATLKPDETIAEIIEYFQKWKVDSLGIASFGPIDLNPKSETYGYILQTPKEEWAGCNLLGAFESELHIPIGLDTDVNGAVLGEVMSGAAVNCCTAIYITVGTGIGVGVYINGNLLHGAMHPEAGHMLLERRLDDWGKSSCPFHDNCVEGLASGPAIENRWGAPAYKLYDKEDVWALEAYYLSQAISNYILAYSPEKVILGGGVMNKKELYPLIRETVKEMLKGYVQTQQMQGDLSDYIVEPGLGNDAGIMGAIYLAQRALNKDERRMEVIGNPHYTLIEKQTDNLFLNMYHMAAKTKHGKAFEYYFASRNNLQDVVPLTQKKRIVGMAIFATMKDEDFEKVVLVRQYRYPVNDYIYELPAGLIEENETPEEAAIREMKEETGLDLEVYTPKAVGATGEYYLAQGMSDESGVIVYGYASGRVSKVFQEESEDIQVVIADQEEVRRILKEEKMSVRARLMLCAKMMEWQCFFQ